MSTGIHLFLESIPPPLAPVRAAQSNDPRPPWFHALTLPDELVDELVEKGLAYVAWIRWLCATVTGAQDARVYSSDACEAEPLLPTMDLPCSSVTGPTSYWIRVQRTEGENSLPIHPKDAQARRLSSRPVGDSTKWAGLTDGVDKMLVLRDLNRCQVSGANRSLQPVHFHRCHVMPRRRGNIIFMRLLRARTPADVRIPKGFLLDSLRNLVSMSVSIHNAWDANAFCLVPFPNVAYDSHGRPLEYGATNDEDQPAPLFVSTEIVLDPSSIPAATRQRPLVRLLYMPDLSEEEPVLTAIKQHDRLRGPFGLEEEGPWPPEWLWSYRAASQIVTRFGEPALLEGLRRFWDAFYVDPRGSEETGSSVTTLSATITDDDDDDGAPAQVPEPEPSHGTPRTPPSSRSRDREGDPDPTLKKRRAVQKPRRGARRAEATAFDKLLQGSTAPDPFEICERWLEGTDAAEASWSEAHEENATTRPTSLVKGVADAPLTRARRRALGLAPEAA